MGINLLLVGAGKMGGALLQRMAGEVEAYVVDPAPPSSKLTVLAGVNWLASPDKIDPAFAPEIVVFATKPQYAAQILPAYKRFEASVFLSIMAGTTLAGIAKLLGGQNFAVVRSMPNLPASIGQGISVAVPNKNVNSAQRALCAKLLGAFGTVVWTGDENHLDAVTALSGSGPAYVFALIEAMAAAGEKLGLPQAMAQQLARQTVIGSGALLAQSKESPEVLRAAVTSPAGTTEAALKQLLAAGGLQDLMLKTMKAAAERAKELAR